MSHCDIEDRYNIMGTTIYKLDEVISEEEKKIIHDEIEQAQNMPIEYDEDCPELTHEMPGQLEAAVRNCKRTR